MVTLFFFFLFLFIKTSFSQGNITTEQVDIVKAYQPLLADAEKIDFPAEPAPVDSIIPSLDYDVRQHLIAVPFSPAEIRAVSPPKEEPVSLQNNILKAGFGMQLTPLLDLHLHNGRTDKYSYGINLHHLSSNGSKIAYQDFSHTGGDLFGSVYVGGSALSASVGYDHRKNYNYAQASSDTNDLDKKSLKRTYNLLPVEIGLQNTKKLKGDFNYLFNFRYHHFDAASQNSFVFPEKEDYFNFSFTLQKQIQKIHGANLKFTYENLHNKAVGIYDTMQSVISVVPFYQLNWNNLQVSAGVNISVFNKDVALFPSIHGEYKLIGEYLIPYIGWEGLWKPVTMPELSTINPFIGNTLTTVSKINDLYLGLKGSYGNNISYNLRGGFQTHTNLPLFSPQQANPAYYDVQYYYDVNIINVHAEIGYRQSERINLLLSGDANSYDMDFDDQPLGLPKSKLTFSVNYNLQNKIFAQIDLFANSGAYTILPGDSAASQLKGRVDANFSLTYNYKKNIAFWASLNNIFAAKSTPWYNYPSYGFQAMAGVKLKF